MADPNVKLHFVGEAKGAEAVIAGLERKITALDAKLKHGFGGGRGAHNPLLEGLRLMRDTVSEISREILGIGIPTSPFEAVHEILGAIRREIENIQELQGKARMDELGIEGLMKMTWFNLGPDEKINMGPKMLHIMEDLAGKAGVTRKTALNALAFGFTARAGDVPAMDVVKTAEPVLKAMAGMPDQDIRGMMVGVTALKNLYPKLDPKDVFGWIDIASTVSPVLTLEKFSRHVVPPMAATAKATGDNLRFLSSEFVTMLGMMTDIHGRRGAYATTAAALRMRETIGMKLGDDFPELKTHEDRVRFMWAHPDLAKAYIHGGEWQGRKFKPMALPMKAKPAYEMYLKGQPEVMKAFGGAYAKIPDIEAGKGRERYEANIKAFASMAPSLIGELDRRLEHTAVSLRTAGIGLAEAGAVRAGLPEILQAAGVGSHKQKTIMALWEAGTQIGRREALGKAIPILEERAAYLAGPKMEAIAPNPRYGGWGTAMPTMRAPATPEDIEASKIIKENLPYLKELNKKFAAKKVRRDAHAEKKHE